MTDSAAAAVIGGASRASIDYARATGRLGSLTTLLAIR
jgi:hypothetical protein